MEQLEERFYNFDELAEVTGINRQSKNFKRDVENILDKWAYRYKWEPRQGAFITHIPTTPEERFQELLVRQFHVDIQVDMYAFACFVTAFDEIDGFGSMPWEERAGIFEACYGIKTTDKTLRSWCAKLIDQDVLDNGDDGSIWKTEYKGKEKIQSPIPEEEYETANQYKKRRQELKKYIQEDIKSYLQTYPEMTYKEACKAAWKALYYTLWAEFHCCYYSCKDFYFKAWIEQGEVEPITKLAKEIVDRRRSNG